jgi:hypothetical protein
MIGGGFLFLSGCPTPVDFFYPMDVDGVAIDGDGNPTQLLITDHGSDLPDLGWQDSRVTLVDLSGAVLWEFDNGSMALNNAHNADFHESGDRMIISDTGNDRVIILGYPDRTVLWDSKVDCPELSLDFPNDANFLENGNLLITLRDAHMIIEVNPDLCNGVPDGEIVWSFGEEGVPRGESDYDDPYHLNGPHNADYLPNGNIIVADSGPMFATSRVIEIDPDDPLQPNRIVWIYQQRNDCVLKGSDNSTCPGLYWCRDADVTCSDPTCNTGTVVLTGMHQSVAVLRNLSEAPPPGESIPRGTIVPYRVHHSAGYCYDSDWIPQWEGNNNRGKGFFLVSNHGPTPLMFVKVVEIDAQHDYDGLAWQLPSPYCTDRDGDGYGNPGSLACPYAEHDCNDANPNVNHGVEEGPIGDPTCFDGLDNDCDTLIDNEDRACLPCDTPEDCDDGNPCTDETCESRHCVYTSNVDPCDDGDPCTMNDSCTTGVCAGDPLDADGDTYVSDACGGSDCNDGDSSVHPAALEEPYGDPVCSDELDNDCDGLTDNQDAGCQE